MCDSRGAAQHLAPAAAAARARAKQPRKYLAVHAPELAVEPHLQILRRHRRSLLLRLEHPHRSALENHVHRLPRLGDRRSLFVRVGITHITRAYALEKLRESGEFDATARRLADYLKAPVRRPATARKLLRPPHHKTVPRGAVASSTYNGWKAET